MDSRFAGLLDFWGSPLVSTLLKPCPLPRVFGGDIDSGHEEETGACRGRCGLITAT